MKRCDLHMHSVFSDGTLSPSELVALAEETGLSAIALTDHNTVLGLKEFMKAGETSSVSTIPGCEFTTEYRHKEIHMVGLFLQEAVWEDVENYFTQLKESKRESNHLLIQNLQNAGYEITYEEAAASTEASEFNRAHVATLLRQKGYIRNIKDAFDTILKEGNGYYIPPKRLDVFQTIRYIKSIDGVAVLAHPFLSLTETELREFLPEAKKSGLDAMETRYSEFDAETTEKAQKIAEEYEWLQSGGSDFLGEIKPGIQMGSGRGTLCVPMEYLESLQKRRNSGELNLPAAISYDGGNGFFYIHMKYNQGGHE